VQISTSKSFIIMNTRSAYFIIKLKKKIINSKYRLNKEVLSGDTLPASVGFM